MQWSNTSYIFLIAIDCKASFLTKITSKYTHTGITRGPPNLNPNFIVLILL